MSDDQKGLIGAVNNAEQRRCARHIYVPFRQRCNGVLMRNMFWMAAKAPTPYEFEHVMDNIKKESKSAYKYLTHKDRDRKTWNRAFFRFDSLIDNVENNACECFNAYILPTRRKPIVTMLEELRVMLMQQMKKMREFVLKYEDPDDIMKVPRKDWRITK